jgi:lipopolysaccharide heptosyltransferase I
MSDQGASTAGSIQGPTPAPRRVLIVLMGSIGDVVRALPLLGRLRRGWPLAHIAWAVEPKSAPVLEGHPWLDATIVFERGRAIGSAIPFLRGIRARRFDLVLDMQRILKSGVVAWASGAPDRIGFHPANTKEGNHFFAARYIEPQPPMRLKMDQYQAFGDALGLAPAPIAFGLGASQSESARAQESLKDAPRPLLGVILGSSWESRVYFPSSIAAVIRGLFVENGDATRLFPVLLGGPGEAGLASQVIAELKGTPALNLAGRTSIRDLIAIFPECAAAFGPDSGPMHIAAAVGCPVVSLWGATAPERSAPWGFADLAVRGEIPCHPCYLRRCPIGRECMRRISPATVIATVRRAVAMGARAAGPEAGAPAGGGVG